MNNKNECQLPTYQEVDELQNAFKELQKLYGPSFDSKLNKDQSLLHRTLLDQWDSFQKRMTSAVVIRSAKKRSFLCRVEEYQVGKYGISICTKTKETLSPETEKIFEKKPIVRYIKHIQTMQVVDEDDIEPKIIHTPIVDKKKDEYQAQANLVATTTPPPTVVADHTDNKEVSYDPIADVPVPPVNNQESSHQVIDTEPTYPQDEFKIEPEHNIDQEQTVEPVEPEQGALHEEVDQKWENQDLHNDNVHDEGDHGPEQYVEHDKVDLTVDDHSLSAPNSINYPEDSTTIGYDSTTLGVQEMEQVQEAQPKVIDEPVLSPNTNDKPNSLKEHSVPVKTLPRIESHQANIEEQQQPVTTTTTTTQAPPAIKTKPRIEVLKRKESTKTSNKKSHVIDGVEYDDDRLELVDYHQNELDLERLNRVYSVNIWKVNSIDSKQFVWPDEDPSAMCKGNDLIKNKWLDFLKIKPEPEKPSGVEDNDDDDDDDEEDKRGKKNFRNRRKQFLKSIQDERRIYENGVKIGTYNYGPENPEKSTDDSWVKIVDGNFCKLSYNRNYLGNTRPVKAVKSLFSKTSDRNKKKSMIS